METAAQYGPITVRPRLTVVKDGGVDGPFSALPHAVLFSGLSDGAVRLYAVLQAHWWGPDGVCSAQHATLSAEMRCGLRSLRRYLDELIEAELIAEEPAGVRREKVYRPKPIGQKVPIETVNRSEVADYQEFNRPKATVQSAKSDTVNTSFLADSKNKTPEKKTKEEDLPPTGVGAAVAADPPPVVEPSKKSHRRTSTKAQETAVPETIALTDQSYETAAKWGYGRADVDFQLERFLSKALAKGWRYVDWKAAFRNWLLNEVQYAKQDGRSVTAAKPQRTNGAATVSPGAADKQKSKWAGSAYRVKQLGGASDGR